MADEQQEASACVAAVLEAMREPGFRVLCVNGVLGAESAGFVFIECPLATLKTVAKLLPMTADRPAEQRFKPLLARAKAVSTSDAHLVRTPRQPPRDRRRSRRSRYPCALRGCLAPPANVLA